MKLAGIDFGAKLAGTTVVCTIDDLGSLNFLSSEKKQDADIFLINSLELINPHLIAMDAPLSLPAIYSDQKSSGSFFYRLADIETGAMSPMFLGGLTARAMQLQAHLKAAKMDIIEAYPAFLAKLLKFPDAYKKENQAIEICFDQVKQHLNTFGIEIHSQSPLPQNWHEFDALLALTTAIRFHFKQAKSYGHPTEGLIWS